MIDKDMDKVNLQTILKLNFDPRVLRERYATERGKRLRPDASKQYIKIQGEFEDFRDDKTAKPTERNAVSAEPEVLIIGAGFGGLQVGAQLCMRGIEDVLVVDRAADVGGNWYWNQYPGAACDSESYCYLPLLEETGYMPSQRYIDAQEIQGYARVIADHFHLSDKLLMQTGVTRMVWNDESCRWTVETDCGDVIEARFVIIAGGETVSPKLPGIPGIKGFKGHAFHSARWDYAYTGGSMREQLSNLADKRVAVIGTGASSIQCVAALGASAKQLLIFQRTPSGPDARDNSATDPEWWKKFTAEPGWQDHRMQTFLELMELGVLPEEPLNDRGFGDQIAALLQGAGALGAVAHAAGVELDMAELLELANMQYMERLRARCAELVEDRETAEALKPYYALGCKRPTWNDDYLPTFNRPNVTLIDTDGKGVERITSSGVVANGVEHEVDLIIYASGLEIAHPAIFTLARYPIIGRDSVTLDEHWSEGFRTFFGIQVHKMPNYFHMTVIGNGLGANYLHGNGKQAEHIAEVVRRCVADGIVSVEPTAEAEDEWHRTLEESQSSPFSQGRKRLLAACTPTYYNNEGDIDNPRGLFANIFGTALGYNAVLEKWRVEGSMSGLTVRHRTGAAAQA